MPRIAEYTEGCTGCRGFGYHHNVQCKRRTADRAAIASHEGSQSKRRAADRAASASHVGSAISIQTTIQAAGGAAISSRVGGFSNQIQVATQAGVQAKAVGAANQETQSRDVHVRAAAVQVEGASETQLPTVDQNMADAQKDHDMAEVAVVEHPHPHEDEENVEWDHPEKVNVDEDGGTTLDLVQVRACVEREMAFMGELGVGEPRNHPKTGKVWSTRWCYRRKGDVVRSRLEVRQFR